MLCMARLWEWAQVKFDREVMKFLVEVTRRISTLPYPLCDPTDQYHRYRPVVFDLRTIHLQHGLVDHPSLFPLPSQ